MQATVLKLLSSCKTERATVAALIAGPKELLVYVLYAGIRSIAAKGRHKKRRDLKRTMVDPNFAKGRRKHDYRVTLSAGARRKLKSASEKLFATWCIGGYPLAEYTKEMLESEASKERSSARGHSLNAMFLERLAKPMAANQTVPEYWQSVKAVELIREELWKDAA